jgi:hypothetical protein
LLLFICLTTLPAPLIRKIKCVLVSNRPSNLLRYFSLELIFCVMRNCAEYGSVIMDHSAKCSFALWATTQKYILHCGPKTINKFCAMGLDTDLFCAVQICSGL